MNSDVNPLVYRKIREKCKVTAGLLVITKVKITKITQQIKRKKMEYAHLRVA
jgi:hypothetical protein